jgi:hypothetical protein
MATINDLVNQIYLENLGRAPDQNGAEYWASQLAAGASPEAVRKGIAQAREGQEFLTQAITSSYGQKLGREAEDEGFQYWLSSALSGGKTAAQIQADIAAAAAAERAQRGISSDFTELQVRGLNADPWGGRRPTTSIYDIPTDPNQRVNISYIDGRPVQFVSPITNAPITTYFGGGKFTSEAGKYNLKPGEDVLSDPVVIGTLNRALNAGTLDIASYNKIANDLKTAQTMEDVRAAFSDPKAYKVLDAIYGLQTGEDIDLSKARLEAKDRQAVIDSLGITKYPSEVMLGEAYKAAGLNYPFGMENYNYDTMMTRANVVDQNNFTQRVNQLLNNISQNATQRFGGLTDLQTPLTGQYYSETGLQPGFTPVGTEGTMFRSGVAGYIPQAELPTGFTFGAPPVNATFQQYRPGAFQPEGVTTGGFITGYDANQQPIYSTYNNPNVNVGGVNSTLNPLANQVDQLNQLMADYNARQAAQAAQSQGGG